MMATTPLSLKLVKMKMKPVELIHITQEMLDYIPMSVHCECTWELINKLDGDKVTSMDAEKESAD